MSKVSKEGKKKAGRKIIDTEAKNKRTAQNRAAQRAFRERKEAKSRALEETIVVLKGMNSKKNSETEYLKECSSELLTEVTKYRPANEKDQGILKRLKEIKADDLKSVEVVPEQPSATNFMNSPTNITTAGSDKQADKTSSKKSSPHVKSESNTSSVSVTSEERGVLSHTPTTTNTSFDTSPSVINDLQRTAANRSESTGSWMDSIFDQDSKSSNLMNDQSFYPFDNISFGNSPVITNNWGENDMVAKQAGLESFNFAISNSNSTFGLPAIATDISDINDINDTTTRIEPQLAFPGEDIKYSRENMVMRRESSAMNNGGILDTVINSPIPMLDDNSEDILGDFTCSCQNKANSCPTRQLENEAKATPVGKKIADMNSDDVELRCELSTQHIIYREPLSTVLQLLKRTRHERDARSSEGKPVSRCEDICGTVGPSIGYDSLDFENLCAESMNKAKISDDGDGTDIVPKRHVVIKAGDSQRTLAKHISS